MKTLTALLLMAGPLSAYELHEWGTFTTVAGSDGVLLSGLQREEAPLPIFTHSHEGMENGNFNLSSMRSKGFTRPLRNVTVKMETPVIYFHSDKAFDATVKVGFDGGSISQWYPERSAGETLPPLPAITEQLNPAQYHERSVVDFSKGWKGSIEWQAKVLSPEDSRKAVLFKPGETLHWTRPRISEANVVQVGKEKEGFLFYRGVGNFDPGLKTTVSSDDTLTLENKTGAAIPFAFVFEKQRNVYTRWKVLKGGMAAGASAQVPLDAFTTAKADPMDISDMMGLGGFQEDVYREMVSGLTATGLLESEAKAMVETWWTSYFGADGLRVFWVVPEGKTAKILPLDVSPAPDKQVRVIVGRSEVLRPSMEQRWLAMSKSTDQGEATTWQVTVGQDRFGMAYKQRVEALGGPVDEKSTAATE